ncbi:M15 family metallopeptidase [Acerihabitans sp. KWT182]|uniref:M15 family metallopeptidase n=1 Tax=Acerihabitans sp. KWT182 TaxID=3157919 RepID=A0AAU7Q705_9GAMM
MMTPAMLTGQTDLHVVSLSEGHRLQSEAVAAFNGLRQAGLRQGFNLQPASGFRDFQRQLAIWNGKFRGERPLLDKESRPINSQSLSVPERCEAILRWSALPGTSRHHWGSDVDVYDPDLLPAGGALQLTPAEYQPGGYFSPLSDWLTEHMADFDFYRPYASFRGGVAIEPWHLSYRPLACRAESLLTPDIVLKSWQDVDVAGSMWIIPRLPAIFRRYISNVDKE